MDSGVPAALEVHHVFTAIGAIDSKRVLVAMVSGSMRHDPVIKMPKLRSLSLSSFDPILENNPGLDGCRLLAW